MSVRGRQTDGQTMLPRNCINRRNGLRCKSDSA